MRPIGLSDDEDDTWSVVGNAVEDMKGSGFGLGPASEVSRIPPYS